MAQLLDIEEGDTVNYRVVVIRTTEPLIYAISLIPVTDSKIISKKILSVQIFQSEEYSENTTLNLGEKSSLYTMRNKTLKWLKYSKQIHRCLHEPIT